jgi:hypothetical protein
MARLVSLATWAAAEYGDDAPDVRTLQRWAKSGQILPVPEKHGKQFFCVPSARYCDRQSRRAGRRSLVERMAPNESSPHAKRT